VIGYVIALVAAQLILASAVFGLGAYAGASLARTYRKRWKEALRLAERAVLPLGVVDDLNLPPGWTIEAYTRTARWTATATDFRGVALRIRGPRGTGEEVRHSQSQIILALTDPDFAAKLDAYRRRAAAVARGLAEAGVE
jgi:hypothetical protein